MISRFVIATAVAASALVTSIPSYATMSGGDNNHQDATTGYCTTSSGTRYGQATGRGYNASTHVGGAMYYNMTTELWFYDKVALKWNMKQKKNTGWIKGTSVPANTSKLAMGANDNWVLSRTYGQGKMEKGMMGGMMQYNYYNLPTVDEQCYLPK